MFRMYHLVKTLNKLSIENKIFSRLMLIKNTKNLEKQKQITRESLYYL